MEGRSKLPEIIVISVCVLALVFGAFFARKTEPAENNPYYTIEYELVKVTQILHESYAVDGETENALRGSQSLNVVVLTGRFKGDVMPLNNYLGPLHEKLAKKGTVLTVTITSDSREDGYQMSVVNYDYTLLIAGMIALFVLTAVVVGRKKGVMSLIGLAYSLLAILFFLVPMWLKGYRAIPLTLTVCAFITAFSFTLLGGISAKTVSAMLGAFLCVLFSCGFAAACGAIAGVSGMNMEEAEWLLDESRALPGITLNVRGLLVSGIMISALGAVMDVAMSIASALYELHSVEPSLTSGKLFSSGMNIGRDMIGTMTNTLILAFVGSSLNLIIIMSAAGMQFYQLINNNDVIMELIRGIAGSIGLMLAVPLTAGAASALLAKRKKA
ncbi:MAG: YibE/F family protein [Clostridiales bacterium]|nr:YibE/F family protein [Clostridiales bacterium]